MCGWVAALPRDSSCEIIHMHGFECRWPTATAFFFLQSGHAPLRWVPPALLGRATLRQLPRRTACSTLFPLLSPSTHLSDVFVHVRRSSQQMDLVGLHWLRSVSWCGGASHDNNLPGAHKDRSVALRTRRHRQPVQQLPSHPFSRATLTVSRHVGTTSSIRRSARTRRGSPQRMF